MRATWILAAVVGALTFTEIARADPVGYDAEDNGYDGVLAPAFQSWFVFEWGADGWSTPIAYDAPGPLHLYPVRLLVVDAFLSGDRFEVYDFGVLIGTTSPAEGGGSSFADISAILADPRFTRGTFSVAPGPHLYTFRAIDNPYGGGQGYVQFVPEPATLALVALGALGLGLRRRRTLLQNPLKL